MSLSIRTTWIIAIVMTLATFGWAAWVSTTDEPAPWTQASPLTWGNFIGRIGPLSTNPTWLFLAATVLPLGLIMHVIPAHQLIMPLRHLVSGGYALLGLIVVLWGAGGLDTGWIIRVAALAVTPAALFTLFITSNAPSDSRLMQRITLAVALAIFAAGLSLAAWNFELVRWSRPALLTVPTVWPLALTALLLVSRARTHAKTSAISAAIVGLGAVAVAVALAVDSAQFERPGPGVETWALRILALSLAPLSICILAISWIASGKTSTHRINAGIASAVGTASIALALLFAVDAHVPTHFIVGIIVTMAPVVLLLTQGRRPLAADPHGTSALARVPE